MKKLINAFLITLVLLTQFLFSPTPAKAAVTLKINASASSGTYYKTDGLSVSLTTNSASIIVYTLNDTQPKATYHNLILNITNGIQYTEPIKITGTNKKIRAIALPLNILITPSAEAVFTYDVYNKDKLVSDVMKKFAGFHYDDEKVYPDPIKVKTKNGSFESFDKYYIGINCTWYAFARSKYNTGREILFDKPTGLNGGAWTKRMIENSSQVIRLGSDALEYLIKVNQNRPIYNIIVSFPTNPSKTKDGHVLLIDAIIDGKIYYSDNFFPGKMRILKVQDFKEEYKKTNGAITGVVQLK